MKRTIVPFAFAAMLAGAACAESMNRKYVEPTDPPIKERLEWFKDRKLGLMMHFGLYSEAGILESWPLDDDAKWSKCEVDRTSDTDEFKRQYRGLAKSFNPIRLDAGKWADAAKKGGFRYPIFTSKHHDGFCLFTKAQMLELATNYGRIEGLWLDGGWLNKEDGFDIGIEDMIAAVRKITMGRYWGRRFDDSYKSPRYLIHMSVDTVARAASSWTSAKSSTAPTNTRTRSGCAAESI